MTDATRHVTHAPQLWKTGDHPFPRPLEALAAALWHLHHVKNLISQRVGSASQRLRLRQALHTGAAIALLVQCTSIYIHSRLPACRYNNSRVAYLRQQWLTNA